MDLPGWVLNSAAGVFIEVEGRPERLREFILRVEREKPAISFIQSLESTYLDPVGFERFEIRESESGEKTALIVPDIATCPDCLRELLDPKNRRYLYPFTNCTNCGPRFTIIEALPYDRPFTSMKKFKMCPECQQEYDNPADRRFHAQPNACSTCGPQLQLWDSSGKVLATKNDALLAAAEAIRHGKIVAVKGLGGFHLMVDARSEDAVRELRRRKNREAKPFALMYPSFEMVERDCLLDAAETRVLRSPESPIVLLSVRPGVDVRIAPAVAPGNPYLGVMLPYTPLHHLLMAELAFPVVATSGNRSDEPICIDEHEALERLSDIAEVFLVHDRPIVRHVDDSIVRVVMGRELVLRRARGFAPLPVTLDEKLPSVLGVGAHQKNTIASSVGSQIFVSQHIGDLETEQAFEAFQRVVESFHTLYELKPKQIACDMHPNYMSSQYARRAKASSSGTREIFEVQHHYAHVLACMAENGISGPALGVAWDGSGYGPDQTIWGGEFLAINDSGYERFAHLRTFRLPGSEKAVREPRRAALGMMYAMFADEMFAASHPDGARKNGTRRPLLTLDAFTPEERFILRSMLQKGLNSPVTSSAGRLFDAVASMIGARQFARYEGQAAMELEFLATHDSTVDRYSVDVEPNSECQHVDWAQMVVEIMSDVAKQVPQTTIARKFHNTMAHAIVEVARLAGFEKVVLSGGCFQNKLLTELTVAQLTSAGFRPYWHQRIPPNDGGIALGQIVAAARASRVVKDKEGEQ